MDVKFSCFLFLGPEIGKKSAALNELRKDISGSGGGETEETSYYAGETPVSQMVSSLHNLSLFAEKRLFIIKHADLIKKKEDIDLLVSYMASPAANTFLALVSDENGIAKNLEKAVPPPAKRVFYELSDREKSEWVKEFFRAKGFAFEEDTVLTVLELVENNTEALRRECSRLVRFLSGTEAVSAEDVEKWLSHTREESAFTLFSRIASNDFSRSLETLRILLAAKVDPVAVISGLLWCFRKLRDYVALLESGVNDEWEFKKIGISTPGAKRDYSGAAQYYNSYGVETLISLAAEYDYKIRQANTFPKYIIMDEFLYKVHFDAVRRGN